MKLSSIVQVLHQLPDKLESVEHCTLTPEQWRLYCSEVEQGRREMKDGNGEREGREKGREGWEGGREGRNEGGKGIPHYIGTPSD